nr:putative late blight resistance protein homolog R1B-16 [Ipomoea trifida]
MSLKQNAAYVTQTERRGLFQFLLGLRETYSQARNQLLFINSVLSTVKGLKGAYALLVQDEKQRTLDHLGTSIDVAALQAAKQNSNMSVNFQHDFHTLAVMQTLSLNLVLAITALNRDVLIVEFLVTPNKFATSSMDILRVTSTSKKPQHRQTQMAYAAVTSLKGTLHLHFLQSEPRLPLIYKRMLVSLHRNLSFLQESLEESEMAYDDAGAMKDVEAEIRDVTFKAEERIEMELTNIYVEAKGWTKGLACLLRLHGILNEAVKQTDYLKKKLIKIQSKKHLAKGPSQVVYRNLESISWLDSNLCTRDLFTRIPNLKNLGIDDGFFENNIDCFYNCVHLEQLEKLSIKKSVHIHIPCYGTPWASFVPNLKKLKFYKTHLSWSDLTFIGMLPNLEVLKLKNAIARDARMWETSKEGFCKLKRLVIEGTYLERWNAEGDNFPVLECLELHNCHCLQEIPSGFADIITLALIWLKSCWDSVLHSAKLIQEEQYNNYGNALCVRSEHIWSLSIPQL